MPKYIVKRVSPYAQTLHPSYPWRRQEHVEILPKEVRDLNLLDRDYIIEGQSYKQALQEFFFGHWGAGQQYPVGFRLPLLRNVAYLVIIKNARGRITPVLMMSKIDESQSQFRPGVNLIPDDYKIDYDELEGEKEQLLKQSESASSPESQDDPPDIVLARRREELTEYYTKLNEGHTSARAEIVRIREEQERRARQEEELQRQPQTVRRFRRIMDEQNSSGSEPKEGTN